MGRQPKWRDKYVSVLWSMLDSPRPCCGLYLPGVEWAEMGAGGGAACSGAERRSSGGGGGWSELSLGRRGVGSASRIPPGGPVNGPCRRAGGRHPQNFAHLLHQCGTPNGWGSMGAG